MHCQAAMLSHLLDDKFKSLRVLGEKKSHSNQGEEQLLEAFLSRVRKFMTR